MELRIEIHQHWNGFYMGVLGVRLTRAPGTKSLTQQAELQSRRVRVSPRIWLIYVIDSLDRI